MNDSSHNSDEGLVRGIGTWALSANIINMVIGAGIFVLPGVVAAQIGPAALIAYLVCVVIVGLVFLCYAEVGSRVTRSGGSYAYVEDAFGPFAGFVTSTLLWLGYAVFSDAALAVALTNALALKLPLLSQGLPRGLFILALFAFLAVINIVGLKQGVRLVIVNTIAKLVPLVLLAVVGLFFINFDNLVIVEWPSLRNFGAAALVLFFAFGGAETALNSSGEIHNPARTIPRGLLLGVGGIFTMYVALQVVAQGTLGPQLANNTAAPLAAAATVVLGNWGAQLLLLGMVISIFGNLSGDVLNTPRVIFASARDGLLPGVLAKVHRRYHTPYIAILFYAAFGGLVALTGTFKQLAVVASGSLLLIYLGVSLSVIGLRRRQGPPSAAQFRIPGGPIAPVLSAVVILWLLSQMTASEAIGVGALLTITVVIYLARHAFRKSVH
ncbi:MAG: amino acid permease [Xanthomonadales bacterium]|nr:amino acid permease [Xanthomonadales bacterium]